MKKIYRYSAIYALALSFALNTSSCSDFLQVEPTGSLTEEQVFEKIDNVEPLVPVSYTHLNGYELCKEIKADIDLCHIPVIFLTAKNDLESKINGLKIAGKYLNRRRFPYRSFLQI